MLTEMTWITFTYRNCKILDRNPLLWKLPSLALQATETRVHNVPRIVSHKVSTVQDCSTFHSHNLDEQTHTSFEFPLVRENWYTPRVPPRAGCSSMRNTKTLYYSRSTKHNITKIVTIRTRRLDDSSLGNVNISLIDSSNKSYGVDNTFNV